MMLSTTVVAPATPSGIGGLAVIRLSGTLSLNTAKTITRKKTFRVRQAHFVSFYDQNGDCLDDGILIYYQSPKSYTGEDVVEMMCHGNPIIVQSLVQRCLDLGVVLAAPGEFTQRAFLNGKLDLIQAESVGSLIAAQSRQSISLNTKLIKGRLSQLFHQIQMTIIQFLAQVEFELDISEEELQPGLPEQLQRGIVRLISDLETLENSYTRGRLLTRGARVVIVGKPNAGKSTLLNALAGSERAITSPEPGTTRDTIDVSILLRGVVVTLVDTAGLRAAEGHVEQEGVRRTYRSMAEADCILYLHDLTTNNIERPAHKNNTPSLHVYNKYDLLSEAQQQKALQKHQTVISAKTGYGLNDLETKMVERLGLSAVSSSELAITTARQLRAVKTGKSALSRAGTLLKSSSVAFELVAAELREALDALDAVLGKTTPDDILQSVFQSFCVGK